MNSSSSLNDSIPANVSNLLRPTFLGFTAPKNTVSASSLTLVNGTISGLYYLLQAPVNTLLNITAIVLNFNATTTYSRMFTISPQTAFVQTYPLVNSSSIYNNFTQGAQGAFLPSNLSISNNSIIGGVNLPTALSIYGFLYVAYPMEAPNPGRISAFNFNNGTILLSAWNRTGVLNETSGNMEGFFSQNASLFYNSSLSQPVFTSPFYLGMNLYQTSSRDTAENFMLRTFGTTVFANTFVWPDDTAQFSSFAASLIFGGIPFWILAFLCLLCLPSLLCLNWCNRVFCTKYRTVCKLGKQRALVCGDVDGCMLVDPTNLDVVQDPADGFDEGSIKQLLPRVMAEKNKCCCVCVRVGGARGPDVEDDEVALLSRKKKALRKKLQPAPLSYRLCFTCVSLVLGVLCALVVYALNWFLNRQVDMQQIFVMSNAYFNASSSFALMGLNTIYQVNASLVGFPPIQKSLTLEANELAWFATLTNALNLRFIQVDKVGIFSAAIAFELIGFALGVCILVPLPFLMVWSLVLASCTFKWEEDVVMCRRSSIVLGVTLKYYVVLCSALCWLVACSLFYNLVTTSAICYDLKALFVPNKPYEGYFSVKPLPYNPTAETYTFNGFNWAEFFQTCAYQVNRTTGVPNWNSPVNGYFNSIYQTVKFHNEAVHLIDTTPGAISTLNFSAPRAYASYLFLPTEYSLLMRLVGCDTIGAQLILFYNAYCDNRFDALVLCFIAIMAVPIIVMVVVPCLSWVTPNLFRERQADAFYTEVAKARDKRIKEKTDLLKAPKVADREERASEASLEQVDIDDGGSIFVPNSFGGGVGNNKNSTLGIAPPLTVSHANAVEFFPKTENDDKSLNLY